MAGDDFHPDIAGIRAGNPDDPFDAEEFAALFNRGRRWGHRVFASKLIRVRRFGPGSSKQFVLRRDIIDWIDGTLPENP